MDGTEDGESHYDKTHMDDDWKVRCALANPTGFGEFGKAEIVNEIDSDHMHVECPTIVWMNIILMLCMVLFLKQGLLMVIL